MKIWIIKYKKNMLGSIMASKEGRKKGVNKVFLTLKRLVGLIDPHCGFSKNISSRDRVNPCFLVTFNIIISHLS